MEQQIKVVQFVETNCLPGDIRVNATLTINIYLNIAANQVHLMTVDF